MQGRLIWKLAVITGIFFFTTSYVISQTKSPELPKPAPIPAPGNIQLPVGYVYERRRGIDSHVGSIVRSDGFTISHDIGRMAGNYADQYFPEHFEKLRKQTHLNSAAIERQIEFLQNKVDWRQRQRVNGQEVMVVLLKDSTMIASFVDSNANFIAKTDSSDKIADFFLIVLTYQPPRPSVQNRN
jgi:hypothetical protein